MASAPTDAAFARTGESAYVSPFLTVERAMKRSGNRLPFLGAALLLALAGCSPHPAAGIWTAEPGSGAGFQRLEVTYEGRADLYAPGEPEAGRHCFWSGESARAIALACKPASDPDAEEHYRLVVQEDGTATLLRDGEVSARLTRQAR
jgi:hypothetical protein